MRTMASATLLSVGEYLAGSYHPDCEYIDGLLVERHLGERDHSETQREFLVYLHARRRELNIHVFPEQRIQVSAARFRVPDLCVVVGRNPEEMIFTRPPFICLEILSKDDRVDEFEEKIDDYLAFGVRYVWVINPRTKRAYVHSAAGSQEAKDGILRTQDPEITVPLAEIFAAL